MACVSQGCTSDLGGGLPHFFLCYIPLYPATYSEVDWEGGLQSSVGYCSGGFFNISQVLINQPRIHSCAHACMACLSQGSKSDLGGGGATPFFPLLNSIVSCNLIQSSIRYYSGGSRGGISMTNATVRSHDFSTYPRS